MRVTTYLGAALLPYQVAFTRLLAETTGRAIDDPAEFPLDRIEEVLDEDPSLLFLCGLPYTRLRDAGYALEPLVAPVAATRPGGRIAVASAGPNYHGVLLRSATAREPGVLGVNGYDSLSGWVLAVGSGLDLGRFRAQRVTGGHPTSLQLLVEGEIDYAVIDSMVLEREERANPRFAELEAIELFGPAPSPPLVLVGGDEVLATELRAAAVAVAGTDAGRAALELGGMVALAAVGDADYDVVRTLDRRAAAAAR